MNTNVLNTTTINYSMLNGIRPDDDDLITMDGVINEDGTKTIALL